MHPALSIQLNLPYMHAQACLRPRMRTLSRWCVTEEYIWQQQRLWTLHIALLCGLCMQRASRTAQSPQCVLNSAVPARAAHVHVWVHGTDHQGLFARWQRQHEPWK